MPRKTMAVALIGCLWVASQSTAADAKKDEDLIQGTWIMVAMERDGEKQDLSEEKDEKKQITVKFTGDKAVMKLGDLEPKDEPATYKLDSGKKPKQMDMTRKKGEKDQTSKAIYELDGDNLRICGAQSEADERPAEMTGAKGKGTILMTLKRKK